MSRLEKSAKTIALSFFNSVLGSLLSFVVRTVFIKTLGDEYLGLSGLLNNVLGFLSLTELGFASAIGFSLYKPLAENDTKTVSALMSLYRTVYRYVAIFVAVSGIGLFFALDFFVPSEQQPDGTNFAYFAFLFNTVLGYLLSYKTTLISSDNKSYKIIPISVIFSLIQSVGQIIVLYLFKDYTAYLSVQIICSACIMAIQNRYITKKYPQVNFKTKDKLSFEQKGIIKKNIGGLIIAKIGDYLVNSTDNLIITKLVSLSATGLYSNYLTIRNIINGVIAGIFSGITAGMGNVVAVEDDEHKLKTFNNTMFFSFVIYSFEAVCFMCLFNPFIGDIWVGEKYTFDAFTVAVIVINNYLTGLRIPLITMKNAAGKYMEDSWIPFGFAAVNLIASILLVKPLGIAGVFLGTIIGSLVTADWYRPFIIYKTVFHVSVKQYFKKYLLYIFLGFAYMVAAYWLCAILPIQNTIIKFIAKCIIAASLPLIFDFIIFRKTTEFKELINIVKRLLNQILKKIRKKGEPV